MKASRLAWVIVAGCCLLRPEMLCAEDAPVPFTLDKQYSATMVIATDKGQTMVQQMYIDNGKVHMESNLQGMQGAQMEMIIRPDLNKVYQVMPSQKLAMELPYNASQFNSPMVSATGPQGKFELVGPDTVGTVACMKYKVTFSDANKPGTMWIDAATKVPVKMMADDKSYTMLWKNYKAGPQDASLFEVPKDYKVMGFPGAAVTPGSGKPSGVVLP